MIKVLVVDDERLIRDLLVTVLRQQGYEVVGAGSGTEALRIFEEYRPAITLLDLKMPDMNGLRVLERLREIDPSAAILILTGVTVAEMEDEARRRGASGFLQKGRPLDTVLSAVNTAREQTAEQKPGAMHQGTKGSILVVDDEEPIRRLMYEFLSNRGYWVVTARNGKEALLQVDFERPQLIVLDLRMPTMSGHEVLQELRQRRYPGRVVVLTGLEDEAFLKEALRLGSLDVLRKPVDFQHLLLTIQVGLTLSGEQQPGQAGEKTI